MVQFFGPLSPCTLAANFTTSAQSLDAAMFYIRSAILTSLSSWYVIILAFFVIGLLIGVFAKPPTGLSAAGTRAMSDWMFVA